MRVSKANNEDIHKLNSWLSFNDKLSETTPTIPSLWKSFKDDWKDHEDISQIIKDCEINGEFSLHYYFEYYRTNISHIHRRIIFGYVTLVDNVCNPDLDYLDYNKELKELIEKSENDRQS